MAAVAGSDVDEAVRSPPPPAPTIRQALGTIAATAVVQARDLVVDRLDHWAAEIRHANNVDTGDAAGAVSPALTDDGADFSLPASPLTAPVLVGAIAGATVAWLLARRLSKG